MFRVLSHVGRSSTQCVSYAPLWERIVEYGKKRFAVGAPRRSPVLVLDLGQVISILTYNPTNNIMSGPTPLSEGMWSWELHKRVALTTADSMIRYRLIHPDKETRPFAKRLHRYAAASSLASSSTSGSDTEDGLAHERDMIRLEMLKWKLSVERMLGSARNLERQRETYVKRAEQTGESLRVWDMQIGSWLVVSKTDELRQTLEEEKVLLATRRRERDRMIKCDEVAAKVTARGKSRQELDEWVSRWTP
jgi:hypothetical protein